MAGSNTAEGMHVESVVFVVYCVGGGLCDELITRSEDSCRLCLSDCDWSRNLNSEVA